MEYKSPHSTLLDAATDLGAIKYALVVFLHKSRFSWLYLRTYERSATWIISYFRFSAILVMGDVEDKLALEGIF